jgi:hypothetical protein
MFGPQVEVRASRRYCRYADVLTDVECSGIPNLSMASTSKSSRGEEQERKHETTCRLAFSRRITTSDKRWTPITYSVGSQEPKGIARPSVPPCQYSH